jgi:DNA-binding GntR family transcriptional regulator
MSVAKNPILHRKTADSVENAYRAIRAGILSGAYAIGQHITGETLAAAIGVSRTPVREALRRLHAEGLVRVVPNQGAYVIGFTTADIAQMFALRAVLESYACELATPRLTLPQIDFIAEMADRTYTLARQNADLHADAIADANNKLHLSIIRAAANAPLTTMVAGVIELSLALRTLRIYSQEDLLRSAGHHRELAEAFRARDPAWASAVMRSHLLAARGAILGEKA